MSEPFDNGGSQPSRASAAGTSLPVGRVVILLVLFVVAVIALVGQVNARVPAKSSATATAGAPAATSTTTTQAPPTSTTTTLAPSRVAVLSANGSTVTNAATTLATQLKGDGWNMLAPVNATANVSATSVYYAAGFQPSADTIAGLLRLTATSVKPISTAVPVSSLTGADVIVVLGPDTAGKTLAAPASSTTATTSKAS